MRPPVQIDFYVLEPDSGNSRLKLACRVVEKAYATGHRIHLWARNDDEAHTLDDLLWTFSQSSFVPHTCGDGVDKTSAPVQISHSTPRPEQAEIVVSVADQPVSDYSSFIRVAEIVGCEEAEKKSGRARYRFYRDHGVEPQTHRISL